MNSALSTAQFSAFANLGSVDVLAARLWLDKKLHLETPSNILVGFDRQGRLVHVWHCVALCDSD
jgi:hypothetical protein